MKARLVPILLACALGPACAEDAVLPACSGADPLVRILPFAAHWSLGASPYSGNRVPFAIRPGAPGDDEFGVRIGAYCWLPGRMRLGFEVPYALGRMPLLASASEQQLALGAASESEPRLTGMLSFQYQF
jgi:hypothetical protein